MLHTRQHCLIRPRFQPSRDRKGAGWIALPATHLRNRARRRHPLHHGRPRIPAGRPPLHRPRARRIPLDRLAELQRRPRRYRHPALRDGRWGNIQWVPNTSGDNWLPQITVDPQNRPVVVWSSNSPAIGTSSRAASIRPNRSGPISSASPTIPCPTSIRAWPPTARATPRWSGNRGRGRTATSGCGPSTARSGRRPCGSPITPPTIGSLRSRSTAAARPGSSTTLSERQLRRVHGSGVARCGARLADRRRRDPAFRGQGHRRSRYLRSRLGRLGAGRAELGQGSRLHPARPPECRSPGRRARASHPLLPGRTVARARSSARARVRRDQLFRPARVLRRPRIGLGRLEPAVEGLQPRGRPRQRNPLGVRCHALRRP